MQGSLDQAILARIRQLIKLIDDKPTTYTDAASYAIAGCIDVETTGLSPNNDEVIELAIVLFAFDKQTGEIVEVLDEYTGLREPACAISRRAYEVHGLSKEQLRGKKLDETKIVSMLQKAEVVISHNARFDYSFVAPLFAIAGTKPWYCSMNGINWRRKGFVSKGLQNLLADHDIETTRAHRALDDVRAIISLLGKCNQDGEPYLKELIQGRPFIGKAYSEIAVTIKPDL